MNLDAIRADLEAEGVHGLTRDQYDRAVEAGVLGTEDRVELLFGRIVPMSPQGWAHAWVTEQLHRVLLLAVHDRASVRSHSPFAASDVSEPEPDVLVYPTGEGRGDHPTHALLIVEVSESSLRRDRFVKAALYAAAGVPEYWVVDLDHRCVHVHRTPGDAGYASIVQVGADGVLTLTAFPDVTLRVAEILP